jgi:hypothetical protein
MKKLLSLLLLAGLITESATATPVFFKPSAQVKRAHLALSYIRVNLTKIGVGIGCLSLLMAGCPLLELIESSGKDRVAGFFTVVLGSIGATAVGYFGWKLFPALKDLEEAKKGFTQEEIQEIIG